MGNEEIIQQEKLTPYHLVKVKHCTYVCYLETANIISNIYITWKYFPLLSRKKVKHWNVCVSAK